MKLLPIHLLFCLALVMTGCEPQRTVTGDFRLKQWEDGWTYSLHRRGHKDSSEDGIIGGTVLRMGWSSRFIVAERSEGWMIIDVQSGAVSGPFAETEFRTRPEAQSIQIYNASEAWKRL
ncbi:MAG: hypothetical protein ABI042_13370 [Verrucomicrobiota bacterium]